MAFGVNWATVLALPRPIYDPGCQPSYEGLVPQSRAVKAAAVAANGAQPAAHAAPMASAGAPVAPVEAPGAASLFREAMGAVQADGTNGSFEVCRKIKKDAEEINSHCFFLFFCRSSTSWSTRRMPGPFGWPGETLRAPRKYPWGPSIASWPGIHA